MYGFVVSVCCDRFLMPSCSEQPNLESTSRRGRLTCRPLPYVGGAAVREGRRLHFPPRWHDFHIAFVVVATLWRCSKIITNDFYLAFVVVATAMMKQWDLHKPGQATPYMAV